MIMRGNGREESSTETEESGKGRRRREEADEEGKKEKAKIPRGRYEELGKAQRTYAKLGKAA